MIPGIIVVVLLFAHFVADFVFQTDEMAKNKSTSWKWLGIHAATYGVVIGLIAAIPLSIVYSIPVALTWVLVNTFLHFWTDCVTSKITSHLWKTGQVHNFFIAIGFDQLVHYVTMFVSLMWVFEWWLLSGGLR